MKEETIQIEQIVNNVEKVIIGKRKEVYNILKGILSGGHILIEDVPGVGKTMMVKALAKSMDLSYSRIQFTPDLLPSDITGVSIFNQINGEFEFKKGPVFSNIVLADEINRTSPKTQSALLEVMEEKQVSEGNYTYKLQEPFFVLATQNPIEYEGTFTLPEAQLDRFMMKVKMGYPTVEYEEKILDTYRNNEPIYQIGAVANREDIIRIQDIVKEVAVTSSIVQYIVKIVDATRNSKNLLLGASIRASLALQRIAQATAVIEGRNYVIPEDVKKNAVAVLSHRISIASSARANHLSAENVVEEILKIIPVPKVK